MFLIKCCLKIGIFFLKENDIGFFCYIKEVFYVIIYSVFLLCKLLFICNKIENIFVVLFLDDEVLWFLFVFCLF